MYLICTYNIYTAVFDIGVFMQVYNIEKNETYTIISEEIWNLKMPIKKLIVFISHL